MYKKFLDATTDLTFKKIFGDKRKTDIVISFLNAILQRKQGHLISEITILDPHNHPDFENSKASIVDIKCKDEKNNTYIIEMQVINEPGYKERAQFYTCFEVASQLDKTDRYKTLTPVIFVGIANFTLFDNEHYLSHHATVNLDTYKRELDLTEYHFIELTKFDKTPEELDSVIDQWTYFLKHASDIDDIPSQLQKNKQITRAFEVLERSKFSREELYAYEKLLDQYRLEIGRVEEAKELMDKIQHAKFEGSNEASLRIAKNLLADGEDIHKVAKLTGLTVDQLKKT